MILLSDGEVRPQYVAGRPRRVECLADDHRQPARLAVLWVEAVRERCETVPRLEHRRVKGVGRFLDRERALDGDAGDAEGGRGRRQPFRGVLRLGGGDAEAEDTDVLRQDDRARARDTLVRQRHLDELQNLARGLLLQEEDEGHALRVRAKAAQVDGDRAAAVEELGQQHAGGQPGPVFADQQGLRVDLFQRPVGVARRRPFQVGVARFGFLGEGRHAQDAGIRVRAETGLCLFGLLVGRLIPGDGPRERPLRGQADNLPALEGDEGGVLHREDHAILGEAFAVAVVPVAHAQPAVEAFAPAVVHLGVAVLLREVREIDGRAEGVVEAGVQLVLRVGLGPIVSGEIMRTSLDIRGEPTA